jgi:hypothetical protein
MKAMQTAGINIILILLFASAEATLRGDSTRQKVCETNALSRAEHFVKEMRCITR